MNELIINPLPQLSGLTEYWLPIPDYLGYEVSSTGRVKSFRQYSEGKLLTIRTTWNGYSRVGLMKKKVLVHRLVMAAFVGEANKRDVDHINRIKTDNRLTNLQYLTKAEHSNKDNRGRSKCVGVNHPRAKLTEREVLEIYHLAHDSNLKLEEIAKRFNTNFKVVSKIKRGISWSHITLHNQTK